MGRIEAMGAGGARGMVARSGGSGTGRIGSMKIALIALAVAVAVLLFWLRQEPKVRMEGPVSTWMIPDSWSIGMSERDGKPAIVRYNSGLAPAARHAAFRKRISITVPFTNPTGQGLPSPEEDQQLSSLEEELVRKMTDANESLFACVITGGGEREFVFYTSNEEAAAGKARRIAEGAERHRVRVAVQEDPDWTVYRDFAGR